MLFQPPDLLPLDPGYFPVPVHVPKNTKSRADASVLKRHGFICYLPQTKLYSYSVLTFLSPVHVEHRGELELVVDLLRSSECLVELKS